MAESTAEGFEALDFGPLPIPDTQASVAMTAEPPVVVQAEMGPEQQKGLAIVVALLVARAVYKRYTK